jgi:hypothetical protein
MFLRGNLQEHLKNPSFPVFFSLILSISTSALPQITTLFLPFHGHCLVFSQLKFHTVLLAAFIFCLENVGGSFLRNVSGYISHYTASQPKIQRLAQQQPWKLVISQKFPSPFFQFECCFSILRRHSHWFRS